MSKEPNKIGSFIARYEENGVKKSYLFNKSKFNQEQAEQWLQAKGIKNFWFFFEPSKPTQMGQNTFMFKGEIGWDITFDILLPYLEADNDLIVDSFGGDLWEGLKIYDGIKALGKNPNIGILGSCASATTFMVLATENSWISPNSRFLIHNPWCWEAGDDEAMQRMADELKKEKLNAAQLYADHTGKTLEEMVALMKAETFLNATETKAYGFVKEIKNETNLIPKAMIENVTKEEMDGMFDNFFNKIKSFLPGAKHKALVLKDANGVDIDFGESVTTIDEIEVGLTGVTVDGSAAEGDYTMPDGRVFTFTAGELTAITEPAGDEEMDALREENETLTTENESLKEEVSNLKAEKADFEKKFKAFKAEVTSKFKPANSKPARKKAEGASSRKGRTKESK